MCIFSNAFTIFQLFAFRFRFSLEKRYEKIKQKKVCVANNVQAFSFVPLNLARSKCKQKHVLLANIKDEKKTIEENKLTCKQTHSS